MNKSFTLLNKEITPCSRYFASRREAFFLFYCGYNEYIPFIVPRQQQILALRLITLKGKEDVSSKISPLPLAVTIDTMQFLFDVSLDTMYESLDILPMDISQEDC